MKGISPIVASVLLIAITMTIAAILAYWSSSYVKARLPSAEADTCNVANFDFYLCRYNATSRIIVFSLVNRANVELNNLTAFINFVNSSTSSGISLNNTLKIGAESIKSFSISDISPDFSSILVKTQCPTVEASSACTRVWG